MIKQTLSRKALNNLITASKADEIFDIYQFSKRDALDLIRRLEAKEEAVRVKKGINFKDGSTLTYKKMEKV